MRATKLIGLVAAVTAVLGMTAPVPAVIVAPPRPPIQGQGGRVFHYSVKFVCGVQFEAAEHQTFVNVQNISLVELRIHARVSEAAFLPSAITDPLVPNISEVVPIDVLRPGQAASITCGNLQREINRDPRRFSEGFLELFSPVELSVVAVYQSRTCRKCTQDFVDLGEFHQTVVPQVPFVIQSVEVQAPEPK